VPTPQELEQKFWKALKSDMTLMLGLDGVEDGHARPMTAQLEHDDRGPIFFFTAKDTEIVRSLSKGNRAIATFVSKGHTMVRKRTEADLVPWIVAASQSLIASFASGITKDIAAVHAALLQPWSNGQTEGQITKLKLVKRQMYGRAKIDLLQARLIGAT
jgi:hypothetical protein